MSLDDELKQAVLAIVADVAEVDPDQVGPTTELDKLGVDSLDGLRIVAAVEKRFSIVIDEAEIARIRTVPDILELVERYSPGTE